MSGACTVRTIAERAGAASSDTRRRHNIYAVSPYCTNADSHDLVGILVRVATSEAAESEVDDFTTVRRSRPW